MRFFTHRDLKSSSCHDETQFVIQSVAKDLEYIYVGASEILHFVQNDTWW